MPYLLEDLVVNRVDLVDEGANSEAFISLYKRKEQSTMDLKDIIAKLAPDHAATVNAELTRLTGELAKAKESATTVIAERETAEQALAKANGDLKTATENLKTANDGLQKAKEDLDTCKAELDTLKGSSTSFDEEETMKSMPEPAKQLFMKMKQQKETAEENVRKSKEAEDNATAIAKAAELKALPIETEKLAGVLKGCSTELFEVLTSINAAMDSAVLGEVGKSAPGAASASSDAAWGKIESKAAEIAKSTGISKAKAITKAVEENPDLYKEYLKGGAN